MTTTAPAPVVDFDSLAAVPAARIPLTFTALADISHGARNSGNTQLLRTRPALTSDGRRVSIPWVSANSLRHEIRDALGWYLVRALEAEPGTLPKRVVDLIWSGGAVTTTGSQANLDMMRRVHRLVPGLGLLGYSAKSDITQGTLRVQYVDLVCQETAHLLPPRLADHPHAKLPSGAMRSEQFGTRHDTAGSPVSRFIALAEGEESKPLDTVQMIYTIQTIKTGAVLYSELSATVPTAGHLAALAVGLDQAAPEVDGERIIYLGGKRAVGFGRCRLEAGTTALGDVADVAAQYRAHLAAHREEILALLSEVTA